MSSSVGGEGVPMGGERVLQLAGHHGRPTDRVRGVTHSQFFICEKECTATAGLEEQTERGFIKLVQKGQLEPSSKASLAIIGV